MWLLIPILFYTVVYLYIRHIYSYWERKGFPTERPSLRLTFIKQACKREFQNVAAICDAYAARKEPLYGIYNFFRPTLLIRDVMLARQLLEGSNGHFANTKWDYVRGYRRFNLLERLAPIFSVGRVESMFRNIEKVADYMVQHLRHAVSELPAGCEVDMQHISRIYAINIISSLVYGADLNNFTDVNNVFASYLQIYLSKYAVSSYTMSRLPKRSSLTYRLRDLLRENIEEREEGSKIRKDILQLMVKFRNGNDLNKKDQLSWHVDNAFVREKVVSVKILSKVAEEFLNMSLDTVASVIVFTLYEALREPAVLQKIYEEIRAIPQKESASFSFEEINGLKYLNLCVQETLRKHPVVPIIERECRKSYNIPDSRYIIGEGKVIIIPLLAIQHDEKHFPEPNRYKPTRFLVTEQHNKHAFMSYGLGVGTCVAKNFANTVIKVALVKLFQNFQMCLNDAEQAKVCYNPAPFIKSQNGLNVKLRAQEIKTKNYLN